MKHCLIASTCLGFSRCSERFLFSINCREETAVTLLIHGLMENSCITAVIHAGEAAAALMFCGKSLPRFYLNNTLWFTSQDVMQWVLTSKQAKREGKVPPLMLLFSTIKIDPFLNNPSIHYPSIHSYSHQTVFLHAETPSRSRPQPDSITFYNLFIDTVVQSLMLASWVVGSNSPVVVWLDFGSSHRVLSLVRMWLIEQFLTRFSSDLRILRAEISFPVFVTRSDLLNADQIFASLR